MFENYTALSENEVYSSLEDPLNKEKKRNIENISEDEYNCMGYAFGTYNWLLPFADTYTIQDIYEENNEEPTEEEYCEADDKGYDSLYNSALNYNCLNNNKYEQKDIEEYVGEIYRDCCYNNPLAKDLTKFFIEKNFNIRTIKSLDELKENEYCIVYSTTEYPNDNDFHFCRIDKGVITHKQGGRPIERVSSINEAFEPRYNSERVMFAKTY